MYEYSSADTRYDAQQELHLFKSWDRDSLRHDLDFNFPYPVLETRDRGFIYEIVPRTDFELLQDLLHLCVVAVGIGPRGRWGGEGGHTLQAMDGHRYR